MHSFIEVFELIFGMVQENVEIYTSKLAGNAMDLIQSMVFKISPKFFLFLDKSSYCVSCVCVLGFKCWVAW